MARAIVLTDSFNRADNTDIGANYDPGYTGWDPLQIVSQRVRATNVGNDAFESINVGGFSASQWLQVRVRGLAINDEIALCTYATAPPTRQFYLFKITTVDNTIKVCTDPGGVFTAVQLSINTQVTWTDGDVLSVETDANGNHRMFKNGQMFLDAKDSSLPSGRGMLHIYANASLSTVEVDSFVGGALVGDVRSASPLSLQQRLAA